MFILLLMHFPLVGLGVRRVREYDHEQFVHYSRIGYIMMQHELEQVTKIAHVTESNCFIGAFI